MAIAKKTCKMYLIPESITKMNKGDYFKARFTNDEKSIVRTFNVMGAVSKKFKTYVYVDQSLLETI